MSAEDDRQKESHDVEAALSRAAKQARRLAAQTGTCVVVMRDGKLVQVTPLSADDEKSEARSA